MSAPDALDASPGTDAAPVTDDFFLQSGGLDDSSAGAYEQLLGDSAPLPGTADSGSVAPVSETEIAGGEDGFSLIDPQAGEMSFDPNVVEQPVTESLSHAPDHNWNDIVGFSLISGSLGFSAANMITHRSEIKAILADAKNALFKGQLSKDMTSGHTLSTPAEGQSGKFSQFASKAAGIAAKGVKFLR